MTATGRYLYAVARGLHPAAVADVPGVAGGRLELVEHRGLVAVVSTVDLEEFGEEGLRRNLESLEWLEETARTHDAVVKAINADTPTAPIRLATVCFDDEAVRRRLDGWHDALQRVLDRVEGRMEWSVKSFVPAPVERQPAGSPAPAPGGGAAYLRAKKAAAENRHAAQDAAVRLADELHEQLARLAVASRRLPPQDPRLTGHEGTMVLNGAYLVEVASCDAFEGAVEGLAAAHPDARIAYAGPWPPYSFAMLEQE